jgi:hypothetical protein
LQESEVPLLVAEALRRVRIKAGEHCRVTRLP